MGKLAVDLICANKRDLMAAGEGDKIFHIPLEKVVSGKRKPELEMFEIAKMLSI